MLVIDRFEGDFAVCEDEDRRMVHVRRSEIPAQAVEGDCLTAGASKGYILDADAAARRKARVKAKMDRLFTERSDSITPNDLIRCPWANADPLSQRYHDTEWGVPCHDERRLFKMLILEGKQAGLSWYGILKKMDTLCAAFDDFDPYKLAAYDEAKIAELLQDPGVIRNRLKVNAAVTNAKAYFKLCEAHGSLDAYIWSFTDSKPVVGSWETQEQMPATTPLSDEISRGLKRLGFKFVGSTIVYSFLQAVGVVNDHLITCSFAKGNGNTFSLKAKN